MFCFFFSSRRRHTRSTRDWSSDVCSSDLTRPWSAPAKVWWKSPDNPDIRLIKVTPVVAEYWDARSEERRVGKECRSRGAPQREKKKISERGDHQPAR